VTWKEQHHCLPVFFFFSSHTHCDSNGGNISWHMVLDGTHLHHYPRPFSPGHSSPCWTRRSFEHLWVCYMCCRCLPASTHAPLRHSAWRLAFTLHHVPLFYQTLLPPVCLLPATSYRTTTRLAAVPTRRSEKHRRAFCCAGCGGRWTGLRHSSFT